MWRALNSPCTQSYCGGRWEKCGLCSQNKRLVCGERYVRNGRHPPFVSPAAALTAQAGTGGIQQAIIDKINLEAEETRQEETAEQNTGQLLPHCRPARPPLLLHTVIQQRLGLADGLYKIISIAEEGRFQVEVHLNIANCG